MHELKYSTFVLMLLIDSSTLQSKVTKACANQLCPLVQRVVMNRRFDFTETSICDNNKTPQWSDDAMFGVVCDTLYEFSMSVYFLSRVA